MFCLDMGNATSLKTVASPDHGSSECLEIELNGILWNCQVRAILLLAGQGKFMHPSFVTTPQAGPGYADGQGGEPSRDLTFAQLQRGGNEPPRGKTNNVQWFPNRSETNRSVQSQNRAKSLKFWS